MLRSLHKKQSRKRLLVFGVISANVLIIAPIAGIIIKSPHASSADSPVVSSISNSADQAGSNPLDQISSANIAETVARMSSLPEATAVTNQADSETTELTMAPATANVIEKPQVIKTASFVSNKDIKTYTSVAGDTITSIASKFGITSDSIRWSNNVSGDAIGAGIKLLIPPVTGIVYTVQNGDTPITLAAKFHADQNKITVSNDAEISGLKPGDRILIPDGTKAAAVARSTAASTLGLGAGWSGSASYGGYNGYDFGYCTYWVAKLRANSGNPVPTNLGNAATWAVRAARMGLPTGSTPRVGAAVVTSTKGAGHVAYVTAVNDDGTITISEMNHAGWNKTDSRNISASGNQYIY